VLRNLGVLVLLLGVAWSSLLCFAEVEC
jgi:hypothetical protein